MTRRRLAVRLALAALVLLAAAVLLVSSAQEIWRTQRFASSGGPIFNLAVIVIGVTTLYIVLQVRAYLNETRPPRGAVACPSCGHHAAAFDRRCRRCGAWIRSRAQELTDSVARTGEVGGTR